MHAEQIINDVVMLEPLRVGHADDMVSVLDDVQLYEFTGGEPPTIDELRRRYAVQTRGGSADGTQRWLNWVVRDRANGTAVGYVQATVEDGTVELAWVIGVKYQGRSFARKSTTLAMQWLRDCGLSKFIAHVHPNHAASASVARSVGLRLTTVVVEEGEQRWESP